MALLLAAVPAIYEQNGWSPWLYLPTHWQAHFGIGAQIMVVMAQRNHFRGDGIRVA